MFAIDMMLANTPAAVTLAPGCERHDVVAALQVVERVGAVHLLQRHRQFAVVERSHEAPALAFGVELFASSFEVGVELRQVLPELVYVALEELVGYEEVCLHVGLLYLVAGFARQDDELAYRCSPAP